MSEHKVKIIAKTAEEFKGIEDLLGVLSKEVTHQFLSAEHGVVGLACVIEHTYSNTRTVSLPATATQICYFDDYIGVYAEPYFIKIMLFDETDKVNYLFNR